MLQFKIMKLRNVARQLQRIASSGECFTKYRQFHRLRYLKRLRSYDLMAFYKYAYYYYYYYILRCCQSRSVVATDVIRPLLFSEGVILSTNYLITVCHDIYVPPFIF